MTVKTEEVDITESVQICSVSNMVHS